LAACFNNIAIAQLLLDYGADINVQDSSGMSTKDYAKKLGQKKMLAFLDERGAKFNRYYQEAQKEEDINNRKAPTEDMGFDSI
jgi:ankyrin repeat protein